MDTHFQNIVRQINEEQKRRYKDTATEKFLLRALFFCFSALVWYCCCRRKRNRGTIQSQPTVATAPTHSSAPGVHAIPLPPPRPHQASHILPQPYSTAPSAPDEPTVATAPTYSSAPGVHAIPLPPPRPHQASHILPQPYSTAPSAPDVGVDCIMKYQ